MNNNEKPMVVIFGRTNVGKSTLFNCLVEKKKALISPVAGTTRDSNISDLEWRGRKFQLIDTGGIMDTDYLSGRKNKQRTTDIDVKVQIQARDYIKQAALILFVVDAKDGLLPTDREMAGLMKKFLSDPKKIILVANKVDGQKWQAATAEFNKLALGEPVAVSAVTGSGTGDLLDVIVKKLAALKFKKIPGAKKPEITETIKVCIIGKPNVGKSSLINALCGEEKIITSPIPHTTREPKDIDLIYNNYLIKLIDTAGITKKGQREVRSQKTRQSLDRQSIAASFRAINKVDIALLVVDIHEGLTQQEAKLVEEIIAKKISLIIVANKWDLVKNPEIKTYTQAIYRRLPFVQWAPIIFTSALTKKNVHKILDLVLQINKQRKIEISEATLQKFLKTVIARHRPAKQTGQRTTYIFELKQITANPPVFAIRAKSKDTIMFSYLKYIANRLREKFGFFGTPITVYVEKQRKIHGKHE
jgi:GTP-binding protein